MRKKRYCPKIFYTSSYKLHIQKNTFNSPKKPYILLLKRKIAKKKKSSSNFSDKEILSTTPINNRALLAHKLYRNKTV